MVQYKLVNKATGKVEGWLIGKTPNRELVFQLGTKTWTMAINAETESKYRIDVVKASTK
jgi:hypothetical protein